MDDKTFNEMIEIVKNRFNQLRTDVIGGKITSDEYYTMLGQFEEEFYKKYPAIDENLSDEQNEKLQNLEEINLSDEMIESARKNGTLHELIKISDESNEDLLNKHKISIIDIIQSKLDLSDEYNFRRLCYLLRNQNITLNENEKSYINKLFDNPSFCSDFYYSILFEDDRSESFIENNFNFILEHIDKIDPEKRSNLDYIIDRSDKVLSQISVDKLPVLFERLNYLNRKKVGKYLIDKDINYIFSIPIESSYIPGEKEILQYAVNKGLTLTEDTVKKLDKRYFEANDKSGIELINLAIDTDSNNILLLSPISEWVSHNEKGDLILKENFSLDGHRKYFKNEPMRKLAIDADFNNIFNIPDNNKALKYAISKGFKLTEENCRKLSKEYFSDLEIAKLAIDTDLDNIFNIPSNNKALKYAIKEKGFKLTRKNCRNLSKEYFSDLEIAKLAIDTDLNNIFVIPSINNSKILKYAIKEKGFKLTRENYKKIYWLNGRKHFKDSEVFKLAIDTDLDNIFDFPVNNKLLKYAISKGLKLTRENCGKLSNRYFENFEIAKLAIDTDLNNIFDIPSIDNSKMLKYAIKEKGFKLTRENYEKIYRVNYIEHFKDPEILKLAIDADLDNIFIIPVDTELLKYAISKGFVLTGDFLKSQNIADTCFEDPEFIKVVIDTFKYDYDNLIYYCNNDLFMYTLYCLQDKNVTSSSSDIDELINECLTKSKDFLDKYKEAMSFYQGNKKEFFFNEQYFRYFLSFNNVNVDDFIQYCFGDSYHFMNGMLKYNTSESIRSFKKFLDYYRKQINTKDTNPVSELNAFMNCLKGYDHYKEFCDSLIASNTKLTEDNLYEINVLFNYNSLLDESLRPKSIDDLTNFSRKIFDSNIEQFFTYDDINMKKNMFCRTILNADLGKINGWLQTYGDTLYLTQLQFENKNDIYLCRYIEEMKRYTTLFEFVLGLDDELTMNNIMNEIANNENKKETVLKWSKYFSNYEERINKMYAKETLRNLTDINNITASCLENMLDKESTSKNGVNVYDFSNKNYGLLAHVKSYSEDIDDLATGRSSINQSFICLSAVSYINQRYYKANTSDIIFGYSYLPEENFIMSSTSNMGSNNSIQKYSSKVADTSRSQRGFKDTSRAPEGHNSEFLCYRGGLKPSCIILLNGREPTAKETEIAEKYNLYFVKTQENNKIMVNAPEKIEYKDDYLKDEYDMTVSDISEFKKIMGVRENKRKICIFTDSHGLFEPTAAILEDARKNGATEFYSLGDNVGTGSNPEDVLDLLDIYGVKSVKGNHEMYVIDGVEGFKGHLSEGQVREAKEDSDWTRNKLSKEQIEKIKRYPDSLVIEVAGKKMLLCHHLEDYNTRERLYNPDDYEAVFQGHEHFEKNNSNIYTIRGAGIGYSSDSDSDDLGKAKYIEITEKENGEYSICVKEVPFYVENTRRDLIEEDGPGRDKMTRWLR